MEDLEEFAIVLCFIVFLAAFEQQRNNIGRRIWVRPWIARRNRLGAYHALMEELRIDLNHNLI